MLPYPDITSTHCISRNLIIIGFLLEYKGFSQPAISGGLIMYRSSAKKAIPTNG